MGRRGPPPTPDAILKLRGSRSALSKRRRRGPGATGPAGTPRCPEWLDNDAKVIWRRVVPQLRQMNVLALIDSSALGRYCRLSSRWQRAEKFLEQHGTSYAVKDSDGKVKYLAQFPEVSIASNLAQQLTRLEQEFGMTPSARTRVHPGAPTRDPESADKAAKFFSGA